jgi:hypothetical protein
MIGILTAQKISNLKLWTQIIFKNIKKEIAHQKFKNS